MKAILIASMALVLVACGSTESYNANMKATADSMANYSGLATLICDKYRAEWADAIDNSRDFNDALATVHTAFDEQGLMKQMASAKMFIDSSMKTLQEPPEESKSKQAKLMEFYGVYTQLHSLAMQPDGSLMSFRQRVNDLAAQRGKMLEELNVMGLLTVEDQKAAAK